MTVPTFVGAGTGVTITTGTGTVSKTGCSLGNIIICHMYLDGTVTTGLGRGPTVNIEKLDGTDSDMQPIDTSLQVGSPAQGLCFDYIGRVMANGTCSMDFTVDAAGDDIFSRMYEFSGVTSATTIAAVIENSTFTYINQADTTTDLRDCSVQTLGVDRLALNFVTVNANQAMTAFTGQAGGTWVEAVAAYTGTGTVATLQLQTASMPTAATIDGGVVTITSAGWGVLGTALIPAVTTSPSASDDPPIGVLGRGAGW